MGLFYPTVSQNLLPYGCGLGCFHSPRVDSQRFKVRTGNPLASLPHATPQPRIAMQDSQHPLDDEHFCSDQAGRDFSVPSVDDEVPGTGVAVPGQANRSGSLVSKLAGCVTTSDLTPLSSLLSRHRRGPATYGTRMGHAMLPAVGVRTGMLGTSTALSKSGERGDTRGWKRALVPIPRQPSMRTGSLFPISGADLSPQSVDHRSPQQTTEQPPCSLHGKKSLAACMAKQLQLVAC